MLTKLEPADRPCSPPSAVRCPENAGRACTSNAKHCWAGHRPSAPGRHRRAASPGRATGPVRLVRGPGDFDRFQPGEVLVARATAPAWTPLFARAVAVVTDGGTLAAHASLVAREYGIPAVVATGDATTRLADGQVVTVDGGAGAVHPHN
jgi:rifampicin phosphotransferase